MLNPDIPFLTPTNKIMTDKFRVIIAANDGRFVTPFKKLIKTLNNLHGAVKTEPNKLKQKTALTWLNIKIIHFLPSFWSKLYECLLKQIQACLSQAIPSTHGLIHNSATYQYRIH